MKEQVIDRYITDHIDIAEKYFENQLSNDNEDSNIYIALHYVYFLLRKSKNVEAQFEFEKIEITDKYSSFRLMVQGMIEFYALDNVAGIDKLKQAYALDLDNKWVRLELFYMTLNIEEDYKVFGYLEEAIQIDENYYEAIFQRISYYDTILNCRQIIREILTFPQTYINAEILNTLAFAYYNNFEIDNAKKIVQGSLDIEETGRAYYLSGLISQEEGDITKAIECFNKSYLMEPEPDVLGSKAWALFELDQFDKSEEALLQMYKLEPGQVNLNQIVAFYIKTRNLHQVNKYIDQFSEEYAFMKDGYTIIKNYILGTGETESLQKKYFLKYSEDEILWFKQIFCEYEI